MRRIAFIAACLACAACRPSPYGPPAPPPAPPPPSTTIHVIRRTGGVYSSTTTETLGVLELLSCTAAGGAPPASTDITDPTRPYTARNGMGDELVVPANAAAAGTRISITRRAGSNRIVDAYASNRVNRAQVALSVAGCDLTGKNPTVVRQVTDDIWEDVGGTVSGSGSGARITTPVLTHLSIYALAGGN